VRALFDVGCVAAINTVTPHDNGRFDIVTTGVQRFRVKSIDSSGPFLRGAVDFFEEPTDEDADFLAPRALALFTEYQDALARTRGVPPVTLPELPTDPTVVSYLVAAAMLLDVTEKQRLLTIPDTSARLRVETSLLRRETGLLTRLRALPAVDLLRRRRRGGT
jgi:Lon protease-like protein